MPDVRDSRAKSPCRESCDVTKRMPGISYHALDSRGLLSRCRHSALRGSYAHDGGLHQVVEIFPGDTHQFTVRAGVESDFLVARKSFVREDPKAIKISKRRH